MENFRLSHFSMIFLKAMIKQTFLQEKKKLNSIFIAYVYKTWGDRAS